METEDRNSRMTGTDGTRAAKGIGGGAAITDNNCYETDIVRGKVPDDWRTGHVTPIFKKGSKAWPGSYRLVLLTRTVVR